MQSKGTDASAAGKIQMRASKVNVSKLTLQICVEISQEKQKEETENEVSTFQGGGGVLGVRRMRINRI